MEIKIKTVLKTKEDHVYTTYLDIIDNDGKKVKTVCREYNTLDEQSFIQECERLKKSFEDDDKVTAVKDRIGSILKGEKK